MCPSVCAPLLLCEGKALVRDVRAGRLDHNCTTSNMDVARTKPHTRPQVHFIIAARMIRRSTLAQKTRRAPGRRHARRQRQSCQTVQLLDIDNVVAKREAVVQVEGGVDLAWAGLTPVAGSGSTNVYDWVPHPETHSPRDPKKAVS